MAGERKPLQGPPQTWEMLREQVAKVSKELDAAMPDSNNPNDLHRRMGTLESRFNVLEVSMVRQLEALTAAYQHMAKALDTLVTRSEFDPVKLLVYGISGCILAGAVGAFVVKVFAS